MEAFIKQRRSIWPMLPLYAPEESTRGAVDDLIGPGVSTVTARAYGAPVTSSIMLDLSAVAVARRCVAAVVFALAVTACSSNSTGASNPSTTTAPSTPSTSVPTAGTPAGGAPDPCTLATATEVTATFGEQFDTGKPSGAGSQKGCLFVQSGGADSVYIYVASGSDAATFYSTNRSAYASTDLTGLGDKAFVSNDGGQLGVQQGNLTILIHLVGFTKLPPATLKPKQEAFARVVLGHVH